MFYDVILPIDHLSDVRRCNVLQSKLLAGFLYVKAENWKKLQVLTVFSSFFFFFFFVCVGVRMKIDQF